jgi:hypothetical protein
MSHNDGGSAFPVQDLGCHGSFGMTLRDYFAAKVLAGMAATLDKEDIGMLADGIKGGRPNAVACYVLADAMLAARTER